MEILSPEQLPAAPQPPSPVLYPLASAFWAGLVYGQFLHHQKASLSLGDLLWSSVWPLSATTGPFWRFAAIQFANAALIALVIHTAARLFGSKTRIAWALPWWFLWYSGFALVLTASRGHSPLVWGLRTLEPMVFFGLLHRLYRLSWGQTVGAAVLTGTLAGGILVTVGLTRAAKLITALPWQTLLEPPRLQRVDRPGPPEWRLNGLLDGAPHPLSQMRGKYVFINVWATWCVPCRLELPSLQRLVQHYRGNPRLEFAFVSEEAVPTVQNFLDKHPYGMTFYTANGRPPEFMSSGIPVTFILSPSGRIVTVQEGSMRWDSDATYRTIDTLLQEPDTTPFSAPMPEVPAIDREILRKLYEKGVSLVGEGKYDRAETILSKVLVLRQNMGVDSEYLNTLYQLGNAHYQQRQWSSAESFYKEALLQAQQFYKPDDPQLASYLNALGCVDYSQGRLAEAEVLHGKSIELASNVHPSALEPIYLRNYAKDLRGLNRPEEAQTFELRAERFEKKLIKS